MNEYLYLDNPTEENIKKEVRAFFLKMSTDFYPGKPLCVVDVYNTLLYKNDGVYFLDENLLAFIERRKGECNFFILSYDSHPERIEYNFKFLNESPLLANIPKIFINPRKKGIVVSIIYELLKKGKQQLLFIDDKIHNHIDVKKFFEKSSGVHYISWFPPHSQHREKCIDMLTRVEEEVFPKK